MLILPTGGKTGRSWHSVLLQKGGEKMRYTVTACMFAVTAALSACNETTDLSQTSPENEVIRTAQNPDAVLSPPEKLQEDTLLAARHDRSVSKIPYVGAWAADASGCALIDQGVYDGFAVITASTIRQFEEGCTYLPPENASNVHELQATCQAEGETSERVIRIEMVNSENLKLTNIEGREGFDLIRCNLPR